MKNDKIKELKDNEMTQVMGGTGAHCHFEQATGSLSVAAGHNMPQPGSDEKYILIITTPTAADIVDELKS